MFYRSIEEYPSVNMSPLVDGGAASGWTAAEFAKWDELVYTGWQSSLRKSGELGEDGIRRGFELPPDSEDGTITRLFDVANSTYDELPDDQKRICAGISRCLRYFLLHVVGYEEPMDARTYLQGRKALFLGYAHGKVGNPTGNYDGRVAGDQERFNALQRMMGINRQPIAEAPPYDEYAESPGIFVAMTDYQASDEEDKRQSLYGASYEAATIERLRSSFENIINVGAFALDLPYIVMEPWAPCKMPAEYRALYDQFMPGMAESVRRGSAAINRVIRVTDRKTVLQATMQAEHKQLPPLSDHNSRFDLTSYFQ